MVAAGTSFFSEGRSLGRAQPLSASGEGRDLVLTGGEYPGHVFPTASPGIESTLFES